MGEAAVGLQQATEDEAGMVEGLKVVVDMARRQTDGVDMVVHQMEEARTVQVAVDIHQGQMEGEGMVRVEDAVV
jgi:hypothetical protein